jgi:uncharacterized protein YegL
MGEPEFVDFTGAKDGKVNDNTGKILISCLDRSSSMSGRPFEAVKIGALKIGDSLLGNTVNPFERVISLLYDSSIETNETTNLVEYKKYISAL